MSNTVSPFEACIRSNLEAFKYGPKRIEEVLELYRRRQRINADNAVPNGEALAMSETFDELAFLHQQKAKRAAKTLEVVADTTARARDAIDIRTSALVLDGKAYDGIGAHVARGVISVIEGDARFAGGKLSYAADRERYFKKWWTLFADSMEDVGVGFLGSRRGKAHLPNIVRELFGEGTGDATARQFADAHKAADRIAVNDFNAAGGSLRYLDDYHLPQRANTAKLIKAGEDAWVARTLPRLDWNNMRRPDGSTIPQAEREAVLRDVYDTLATDGANKAKPTGGGSGGGLGNKLEQHRFLKFKSGDDWLANHADFGDGDVFDVIVGHYQRMAQETAAVNNFGPNPETFRQTAKRIAKIEASRAMKEKRASGAKLSAADEQAVSQAEVIMSKFDSMMDVALHKNAQDPNSFAANLATGTQSVLVSAQLGSAVLLAVPGDIATSISARLLNNQAGMKNITDFIGSYMSGMTTGYKDLSKFLARSGFVMDELVSGVYATERFTGTATYVPVVARKVGDTVMRASGMSRSTDVMRGANIKETMGFLHDTRDVARGDHPMRAVMDRYGITDADWDAVRQGVEAWSPKPGAEFLRPMDILTSSIGDEKQRNLLYRKFYTMIDQEAKNMVPGATIEGQVFLRGNSRADTLPGIVLQSFSMYKSFPVSMAMTYGRLAMGRGTTRNRRLAYVASMGVTMMLVGALGTQMREVSKGKEPLPMDTTAFWGKAFLSGGALSIWGDFLFAGINQFGGGPQEAVAGPLAGFVGDTANLVFGDSFAFMEALDRSESFKGKFPERAVEFAKRYTPGTSLWWARLALEREVWDRLEELANPRVSQKRRQRVAKQRRDFGNDYWSAPGSRLLTDR